jgi:hypothetical protein
LRLTSSGGDTYEWISGGGPTLAAGIFGLFNVTTGAVPLSINAAGNTVINQPSSGTALQVTSAASATSAINAIASSTAVASINTDVLGGLPSAQNVRIAASGATAAAWGLGMDPSAEFVISRLDSPHTAITVGLSGTTTIAAPSSGQTLSLGLGQAGLESLLITGSISTYGIAVESASSQLLGIELGTASKQYGFIIGNSVANALSITDNGVDRITLNSAGAVGINPPSSGNALSFPNATNEAIVINSATGNDADIEFSVAGADISFVGVAGTAGRLVTGGAIGDLIMRGTTRIVLSANTGATAHVIVANNGNTTFTGTVTSPTFNGTSDQNLKKDIRNIGDAERIISEIHGVRYSWKHNDQPSAGVVAQHVECVIPELVTTNEDGIKSVNYNGLVGVLVEAVKSLQRKELVAKQTIESLQASLTEHVSSFTDKVLALEIKFKDELEKLKPTPEPEPELVAPEPEPVEEHVEVPQEITVEEALPVPAETHADAAPAEVAGSGE